MACWGSVLRAFQEPCRRASEGTQQRRDRLSSHKRWWRISGAQRLQLGATEETSSTASQPRDPQGQRVVKIGMLADP